DICFARGTFNSHPYVMATMNEFLRYLDEPAVKGAYAAQEARWNERSARLNRRLQEQKLPLRIENMVSVFTTQYPLPSRYNWMLQYYLRAAGLSLSWIGSARFIFGHDLSDQDFDEISRRVVSAGETMRADGWWWPSAALTDRAIRRRVLREMVGAHL